MAFTGGFVSLPVREEVKEGSTMTLTKPGYRPRIIDKKIEEYLELFGAISLEGPKWCGKTWTALNNGESVTYIMDPDRGYLNRERARLDPALILPGVSPHVIDEWQEVPGIWDAVRFDIDQSPRRGKYLLTGSATPKRASFEHSGAGRIAILRMYPMTLYESGDSTGLISLASLFENVRFETFVADIELDRLIELTIRGGWPDTLHIPIDRSGSVAIEYINAIVKNDVLNGDSPKRNPAKLRKMLRALARNNSTTVKDTTLSMDLDGDTRREQNAQEVTISRNTVAEYLADLNRIFVLEEIPGWNPEIRSKTRIRMAPKRVFTDPSLAVAALGIGHQQLKEDLSTFGFMFENLCIRDLTAYVATIDGHIYHYRDNSGLEADAIIEMRDGAWGAFEIKLGEHQVEAAARSLLRLKNKMTGNGASAPKCLAVITGGGLGMVRDDGVYVIPINTLGP
jgi:predicted AAA+ superfamily ATPase